jgi:carboxyl-terminal processing protease
MHTLGTWLVWASLALAAPPELSDTEKADLHLSMTLVTDLAERMANEYSGRRGNKQIGTVTPKDLTIAAAEQMYAVLGKPMPEELRKQLNETVRLQAVGILYKARVELGVVAELAGLKTFLVMIQGFNKLTDPYCGLMWSSGNSFAASDAEFGFGFELQGVSGTPYLLYLIEAQRLFWHGTRPRKEAMVPPTGPRWLIGRVIPGSPAANYGLRPGDRITHFNTVEITAENNKEVFHEFLSTAWPSLRDTTSKALDLSAPIKLQIERPGAKPFAVALPRENYSPDSIFGVLRKSTGEWNHWLDEREKLAYIRIGSIESPAGDAFEALLDQLERQGMKGLILDLRWCPGGYVQPTSRIAGAFLPANKMISKIQTGAEDRGTPREYFSESGAYQKLPLVVLVNGQTTGGGEMIAAALQDYKRATIVGQRTFGKSNIMSAISTSFPGIQYRVSTGYSLRPSGKNRHRFPDSTLFDDWGVKPDRGFEAPVTPELSAWLKIEAERQAIRPSRDKQALPFDDPQIDAQKLIALKHLKEQLRK